MKKEYYGTFVDGQYLLGRKDDTWLIGTDFDKFSYTEHREAAISFVKGMRKKFPNRDIKLAVCTVVEEDV